MDDDVIIRRLGRHDDNVVLDAADLFDNQPRQEWVDDFLRRPSHHIFVACRGDRAIGFVSGVEMTHPDKGTEMFVYELAVAPDQQRRGVARALLDRLAALARERGCYGMWVLTDDDNVAALAAYRSAGAGEESAHVMLTWNWSTRARS